MKKTLKLGFGRRPQIFEDCFGIPLSRPINVRKQVYLNSCYFTTFPGGGGGGGGGVAGGIVIKANSAQLG